MCLQELDALSFQSIGLIAGTPHSVAYLQHLLEEKMIVKLVALDLDIWDVTSEVQELCRCLAKLVSHRVRLTFHKN